MRNILIPLFFLILREACGQVANNAITERITLKLDEPVHSSTRQSDVEWNCINKSLTNKCLIYHNDQWFSIIVPSSGTYYLNIFDQRCRDKSGVQLLLIEGDPCKTDTYKILNCIPTTDYGDFHIRLDSLHPEQEYLLNIDGYLSDQCDFNIELSTSGQGFPLNTDFKNIIAERDVQADSIVHIEWFLDDSLKESKEFQVYRRKDKEPSGLLYTVPVSRNAYGEQAEQYVISDTLSKNGVYVYSIFAYNNEMILIPVKKEVIPFKKQILILKREVEFQLPRSGEIFIYVFDGLSGEPIEARKEFRFEGTNRVILDLSAHHKKGINSFRVVIRSKGFEKIFTF